MRVDVTDPVSAAGLTLALFSQIEAARKAIIRDRAVSHGEAVRLGHIQCVPGCGVVCAMDGGQKNCRDVCEWCDAPNAPELIPAPRQNAASVASVQIAHARPARLLIRVDPVTGVHCEETPRNTRSVFCTMHSPARPEGADDEGDSSEEDETPPAPVASRTRAQLAAARLGPVVAADRILDEDEKGGEVRPFVLLSNKPGCFVPPSFASGDSRRTRNTGPAGSLLCEVERQGRRRCDLGFRGGNFVSRVSDKGNAKDK